MLPGSPPTHFSRGVAEVVFHIGCNRLLYLGGLIPHECDKEYVFQKDQISKQLCCAGYNRLLVGTGFLKGPWMLCYWSQIFLLISFQLFKLGFGLGRQWGLGRDRKGLLKINGRGLNRSGDWAERPQGSIGCHVLLSKDWNSSPVTFPVNRGASLNGQDVIHALLKGPRGNRGPCSWDGWLSSDWRDQIRCFGNVWEGEIREADFCLGL